MKKNFIYALIACFTLSLAACSTDPEDATSKHVYGENENPYLKTNADAVVSTKAEFPSAVWKRRRLNWLIMQKSFIRIWE